MAGSAVVPVPMITSRWQLAPFTVHVTHDKIHAVDCGECTAGADAKIDEFVRRITFEGHLDEEVKAKVLDIAGKCPVHRTLEARSAVATSVETLV
jgi:uncharacterized OsmC-like protein